MIERVVERPLQMSGLKILNKFAFAATDTSWFYSVLAVMTLTALAIRLIGIERSTLWYDEVMTANAAAMPAVDLIRARLGEIHSPAFYLLLHVFGIPKDSIFLVRLPAALFGAATVVTGVFAGRALKGPRAGWMAGLLFGFTPILVDYGQEARPYSSMIFGVVIALWGAARVMRHPRSAAAAVRRGRIGGSRRGLAPMRGAWLSLIGGSIWAVFMLPGALLLWPALDCAIAWAALSDCGRWRRLVRPWIAHRILCVMICLPLAVALAPRMLGRVGDYWYPAPSGAEFWRQTAHAFLFQFQGDPGTLVGPGARAILAFLLLVVAVSVF